MSKINLNTATPLKSREFIPSQAQQAYFNWITEDRGNAVLEAVAGAGKTTTILRGMGRMAGRVWFGVYNKKMATEIKSKIARDPDLANRRDLYTSTFHAAGFSALRFAFSRANALEVDERKVPNILKNMLAEYPSVLKYMPATIACVGMAKNRGIGPVVPDTDETWIDMIDNYDLARQLPEDSNVEVLIDLSRHVLAESNKDLSVIDYDDMVYLPLVRKLRMLQHEWVIVDEAQDTNPTRRALAAKLLAPGGRFVAVGDPRQAIFGFTGADNDSLQQLIDNFVCKTLPLTVTYRCPKAVVEVARKYVSHITAHKSAPDGIYRQIEEEDFNKEVAEWDAREYGDTAILCRLNAPLVSLCFDLIRKDIPAKIEGRDVAAGLVALVTRWKVDSLEALDEKLTKYHEREIVKARKAENANREQRVNDEVDTVRVLMENTERKGGSTVADLVKTIQSLFADDVSGRGIVTLCSAHKSKGLEWKHVYIYGRNKFMPGKWAKKEWEYEQEINLIYVALTRSMNELVDIIVE